MRISRFHQAIDATWGHLARRENFGYPQCMSMEYDFTRTGRSVRSNETDNTTLDEELSKATGEKRRANAKVGKSLEHGNGDSKTSSAAAQDKKREEVTPGTGTCSQNLDKPSEQEMSEEERITMLRKRNAIYSKRKYYKKKKEVSSLEATKFGLEAENQALRKENVRLETLLMEARYKVAAIRSYSAAGISNEAMHSQIPAGLTGFPGSALYPGNLPQNPLLSPPYGSALFPMGTGSLGGMISDPYMLQEAYIRNRMLQQERVLSLQRNPYAVLHSRDMPLTSRLNNPLSGLSNLPGQGTVFTGLQSGEPSSMVSSVAAPSFQHQVVSRDERPSQVAKQQAGSAQEGIKEEVESRQKVDDINDGKAAGNR